MTEGFPPVTRREFLQKSGMLVAGMAAMQVDPHRTGLIGRPLLDLNALARFVDPLPVSAILKPSGTRPSPENPASKIPYYKLAMREFSSKVHRDVKPTRLWGFGNASPGPTFETRSGEPLLVDWVNELPKAHFLPIDHSVHGADTGKPDVRAVTHLHGAKAPAKSDGYPADWWVPGKSALYYYPNHQDAAMLWYHDHTLGITRLNMYAGLFGVFVIRDQFEDGLNLPKGKYEIPLTLYDRSFDREGQLFYPVSPDPESPWVPEVFGDAILVNGKLFPYLEVEPRKYRFRVLVVRFQEARVFGGIEVFAFPQILLLIALPLVGLHEPRKNAVPVSHLRRREFRRAENPLPVREHGVHALLFQRRHLRQRALQPARG